MLSDLQGFTSLHLLHMLALYPPEQMADANAKGFSGCALIGECCALCFSFFHQKHRPLPLLRSLDGPVVLVLDDGLGYGALSLALLCALAHAFVSTLRWCGGTKRKKEGMEWLSIKNINEHQVQKWGVQIGEG